MDGETETLDGRQPIGLAELETLRAAVYALLAKALAAPPDKRFLAQLQQLKGDDTPLGLGLSGLANASRMSLVDIEDEYSRLFYGMGQGGEVLPYASYYLTGSLHDRPLADLRADMENLGIAHAKVNGEPEDHIGFLLEMMHGLIVGSFGVGKVDLAGQIQFFKAHIAPWAGDFFRDLEAADSAVFFASVAALGLVFFEIEGDAFEMAA